ncbi:uncharacterized protein LOC143040547 [Oratosquilla oratoria]|uniref:uncharacterized protein LOC143040547 n=1 Tax=Oratosquilla oratoria TaxID=337810 RepID=UPI003F76801B
MALFDEELSLQEKELFVANIKAVYGSEETSPRLRTLPNGMKDKTVASFATKNTKRFFELMNIDTSFFDEDPANWKDNPSYQAGLQRVEGLVVTNDTAERGAALVQEFTKSGRTKAEEQLQFLLQIKECSSTYLEDRKEITVQIEWVESLLLFQATYHKYDDVTRMHNFQMRREISALEAENYSLERQLISYHNSISYAHSRGTYEDDPPDGADYPNDDYGNGKRTYEGREYGSREYEYTHGLGERSFSTDTEYA